MLYMKHVNVLAFITIETCIHSYSMLDKIEMHIPIDYSLLDISSDGNYSIFGFDLLQLNLKVGSYDVYLSDDGKVKHDCLTVAWDRIPTSHTKMSFKFVHEGKQMPHVVLKASPAKILQGHNVYGTDWIEEGALEMLGYLQEAHPTLYSMLAVQNTVVKQLDATYSARLKDDLQVEKALDFLRNVSSKHIRKSNRSAQYKNTFYWGSERAKWYLRKVYGKANEFAKQLADQQKLAKSNDVNAKRVVEAMSCPKLQAWTKGLLRFETGIKYAVMQRDGIPTNLWDLIQYQRQNPDFLQKQWFKANKEIFKALEGTQMKALDHDSIYENLCNTYLTITPSGRESLTKARNLFNFYCALETHGCDVMKKQYGKTQYHTKMADLISAGYSKAYLQNLHTDSKNNVIPFLKLVEINFNEQLPPDFVEPKSTFHTKHLRIA